MKGALDGFLNFDNNVIIVFKYIPFIENFLANLILSQNGFFNLLKYLEKRILNTVMLQKKYLSRTQK